ncbi:MAG: Rpn family recombination-promoting nuclease/putative transposase, partial [Planctomycetales bacterium]|nr:Rpn family recombination-promoting nuclease/putative transposase [Planctomycetales bacterium]
MKLDARGHDRNGQYRPADQRFEGRSERPCVAARIACATTMWYVGGNMEQLPTPHNNLFHYALTHAPNARGLIESQFPAGVLRALDLDSLQLEKGSFVDPDLRERYSDVLWSVRLAQADHHPDAVKERDQTAYVYFLFEHKSEPDRLTVLQLLTYIVRIWERRVREGLELCPVLPLVIYHGAADWTAARSMGELLQTPVPLAEYQVQFRFPLLDLGHRADEELGSEPILQVVLRLLKYGRSPRLRSELHEILNFLRTASPTNGVENWLEVLGVY